MQPSAKSAIVAGILIAQMTLPTSLWANPTGQVVTHGSATFENDGANLIIRQGTDKLITKWGTFSIAQGEKTQFIQPNKNSAALNRVIGGSRSIIDGELSANGKVILINPAGVTVGPTGVVNVNSFTASTQDITDKEFIGGGDLLYKGTSQETVENHGTIRASGGDAILIAKHVKNSGTVEAKNGVAALVGGTEVLVKPKGEERIFIKPTSEKGASVTQSTTGRIAAASAEIKAAGNPWATAINLEGLVTVKGSTGKVKVAGGQGDTRIAGTIKAQKTDGTGGDIAISGKRVLLASNAVVDASGSKGGSVKIGGGFQGKDATIENASQTIVSSGAQILADATGAHGNGGTVILWADDTTAFYGSISAKGLGKGSGGFAEVSGKTNLVFEGTVDLSSELGALGTLLLDPMNIEIISTVSTTVLAQVDEFADINLGTVTGPLPGTRIRNTTINAATANVVLQATNNIVVGTGAAINIAAAGVGITLQAGNSITSNALITTNGGHITMLAGDSSSGVAYPVGGGNILTSFAMSTGAGGGAITLRAANNITVNAAITTVGGSVSLIAGDATLGTASPTGSVTTGVNALINVGLTSTANVLIEGANVTLNRGITLGDGNLTVTARAGNILLQTNTGINHGNGVIRFEADRDIVLKGTPTTVTQAVGSTGGSTTFLAHTGDLILDGATACVVRRDGTLNLEAGRDMLVYAMASAGASDVNVTAGNDLIIGNGISNYHQDLSAGSLDTALTGNRANIAPGRNARIIGGGEMNINVGSDLFILASTSGSGFAALGNLGANQGITVNAKTLSIIGGASNALASLGYAASITGNPIGVIPVGSDINVNLSGGTGTGYAGKSLVIRGGTGLYSTALLGSGGQSSSGTVQASINVNVNGGAHLQGGNDSAFAFVGNSGVSSSLGVSSDGSLGGKISFDATGDVDLIGGFGTYSRAFIGTVVTGGNLQMDTHVKIGGNLNLENHQNSLSSASIGQGGPVNADANTYVTVGGNLSMDATTGVVGIGFPSFYSYIGSHAGEAHVLVGGDVAISASGFGTSAGITGANVTNLAAGGNVTLTADLDAVTAIGSFEPNSTATIQSAGDIHAISTNGGYAIFGGSSPSVGSVTDTTQSLTLRAAGDIQVSQSLIATSGGELFIEAGATFAAGELWGANATSLNGQSLSAYSFAGGTFTGSPLAANSAVAGGDGRGAFWVDNDTATGIVVSTENGNLTLLSEAFRQDGSAQGLPIDAVSSFVAGSVEIGSTTGDITVAGFHDIEVGSAGSVSTDGNLLFAAWRDINLAAGSNVSVGQKATFVVDEQAGAAAGDGWFRNLGNVSSATNQVAIYAVYGGQTADGTLDFPSQVILGNLASADTHAPGGNLDNKFNTSYSAGGTSHGSGFGSNYLAGNGVSGSGPVVWYKLPAVDPTVVTPPITPIPPTPPVVNPTVLSVAQFYAIAQSMTFLDPKDQFQNDLEEEGNRTDARYQNKRFAMGVDKEKYAAAVKSWGGNADQVTKLSKLTDREYFIERKSFLADAFNKRSQSENVEK